jgi:hypothetical protein
MSLLNIVAILVVVGLMMWIINTYIPMAGAIKGLLNVVVLVVVLIWILQTFGIIGAVPGLRMPAAEVIGDRLQGHLDGNRQASKAKRPKNHNSSSRQAAFAAR